MGILDGSSAGGSFTRPRNPYPAPVANRVRAQARNNTAGTQVRNPYPPSMQQQAGLSMPSGRYGSRAPVAQNTSYRGPAAPGVDPFAQMFGLGMAANAGRFAELQSQREQAMLAQKEAIERAGLARQALDSDYLFDVADSRLANRGNDIQLGNIPLWRQFIEDERGVAWKNAENALQRLGQQDELTREMRRLEEGGFGRARDAARSDFSRLIEDMNSGAVAMGGAYANMDRIRARGFEDLGRAEEDITQQDRKSFFGRQDELRANENQRGRVGLNLREQGIGFDRQQAQLNEREALLKLEAERAGISQARLKANYEQALKKLNLDKQVSAGQLAQMLNSSNAQEQALANEILRQAQTITRSR